ncbi:Alpha/Beta hydrolase protein [Radiomyces spectabilis]|uniref:Alpha/Beta hydrolase protein n=1 Tax=Radiomyces spectabilis TaxID=64574 RepID=UPI00221F871B|nr:Alpha/Beta hydrolase protein [Radiomyces spectabilis]KAI8391427.1 Alpha/Beta hydrolase protein [Radiomyces spectabilis]
MDRFSFACWFKTRANTVAMAYQAPAIAEKPTLCFIPGFRSEFQVSSKSHHVYNWARRHGCGFITWDHALNGSSVQQWSEDGYDILQQFTTKDKLVLVGASMGLWIALLLGIRLQPRIQSIIGIGGGLNFTERWLQEVPAQYRDDRDYIWKRPSTYAAEGYYAIPVRFLLDSKAALFAAPKLRVPAPLYLIHGQCDADAPLSHIQEWVDHRIECPQLTLKVVEDGDHRLSRPQDLALLDSVLNKMV